VNTKNIAILAVITLVLVIIAAQFNSTAQKPQENQVGQAFFPDLAGKLNQVDNIHIQTASEEFKVQKTGEVWGLASSHQYPAEMEQVSKILNGMSSFVLLEPKTANPDLHERLELSDLSATGAKSTLVELKQGDTQVASLLLGKSQSAKADNTRTEFYVRKPGEAQTWLVMGTLNYFSKTAKEWLDKSISNMSSSAIREVQITRKEAEPVRIFKHKAEDADYQLADLPADAQISEMYKLHNLARSLEGLNLDDVVPATGFEFGDDVVQVVFNRFDGLEVVARAVEKESKYYLHLQATAKPETATPIEAPKAEETPATDAAKIEEPKVAQTQETVEQRDARVVKEVEAFNKKVAAWVYLIPQYKYENLVPKKDSLLKLKEQPKAESPTTDSTGEASPAVTPVEGTLPEAAASDASVDASVETAQTPAEPASSNPAEVKVDLAAMLKEAAERAKQNPQKSPDAVGHVGTLLNQNGEVITLPDLLRNAIENAKKQAATEEKPAP